MTLTYEAPGKGEWRALTDHFPRPLTAEYQHLLAHGMEVGEAEAFARYGIPVRTLTAAFVHGYLYVTAAPLIGKAANGLPPKPLLWLAARIAPPFRRRNAAAKRAVGERVWLVEAAAWYDTDRPAWIARNEALDAVDPDGLDAAALAAHLRTVEAACEDGYTDHFRLHGTDLFPTALLLLRAQEWGLAVDQVLDLLAGSSPASVGSSDLPAWRLVTGYDLDGLTACELPGVDARARAPQTVPDVSAVRATVPAGERDEFDRLLADSRATYGLRDDNGMLTGAWPLGLLRRAMLAAGRRLQLGDHAVEATVTELVALLNGTPGPPAAELAERARQRDIGAANPGPAVLGPIIDLPIDALPPAMRLMGRALVAVRDLGTTTLDRREPLHGVGVGNATAVGRACVAIDPNEAFARFEPGNVLVALGTTPAYNALLAVAAAVVTEEGGPLSHAAVMARELGIPAVIGAQGALATIADGALVEVDPRAGRVRVLATT